MSIPYPILFIVPTLGGGGAERALVNVVNHLDRGRFQPRLALFQKEGVFLEELAPDVPVYELQPADRGVLHRTWVRLRAIKRLRAQLRPALVMSVMWQTNFVTALADNLFGLGCPLVTNEQVALGRHLSATWQRHVFWPLARRLYRRVAKVVTISHGIAAELQEHLRLPADRFQVIHNPVDVGRIRREAERAADVPAEAHPILVAVGRLDPQKNYSLLLRAVSRVIQERPITLYILGEGSDRPHLESLIRSLGLGSHVCLLGFHRNPHAYVKRADLFVLSSDYEGFANVVVEALALGTPVIATGCPYGPHEILAGGRCGTLVPPGDEGALARAILDFLGDSPGGRTARPALKRCAEEFSVERIVPQYEQLFLELLESEK